MILLGIETSCDETAVCVLEAKGGLSDPKLKVRGNSVFSQIKIHREFGGVFPMMAKREHAANLVPLLLSTLHDAKMAKDLKKPAEIDAKTAAKIRAILEREPGLADEFLNIIPKLKRPAIDVITVTHGPGLEPALWVGVNFAKALSVAWDIPVLPVNHMEGHIASVLLDETKGKRRKVRFPAVALLVSGGHTQLVSVNDWAKYKVIGDTRDDAVGEAFDKVARMLGLPYPGGPEISKLAEEDRRAHQKSRWKLPRPMMNSGDLDFSFSGLKTAVLYTVKATPELSLDAKRGIAREFEDAAVEVLVAKTRTAAAKLKAKTLILGGGVTANRRIRAAFAELARELHATELHLPAPHLSTDNAIMIAIAGYVEMTKKKAKPRKNPAIEAKGNLKIK